MKKSRAAGVTRKFFDFSASEGSDSEMGTEPVEPQISKMFSSKVGVQ